MNAHLITDILFRETDRHRFQIANIYLYRWESDFFAITPQNDMAYEFEVKISRSDFRADFEKEEKHRLFREHKKTHVIYRHSTIRADEFTHASTYISIVPRAHAIPNRFYYIAPAGVIPKAEVPAYAGLIEITENKKLLYTKRAPTLHRDKFPLWKELLEKYYWQWYKIKNGIKQPSISEL